MILRIKPRFTPRDGLLFKDPRTGYRFEGMNVDVLGQAKRVIAHRQGNPTIYPPTEPVWLTLDSVMDEVVASVCARVPSACYDAESRMMSAPLTLPSKQAQAQPPQIFTCPKCGSTEWTNVYCPTCSGKKLLFRKCSQCGRQQ